MDGLTKVLRMCAKLLLCGIGWIELTGLAFSGIRLLKKDDMIQDKIKPLLW